MGYNLITTNAALREVVDHYTQVPAFVFDVETIGEHRADPFRNRIVWLILATQGRTDVIPMGHPNGDYVRTEFPLLKSGELRQQQGKPLRPTDYSQDARKGVNIYTDPPQQLDPAEVFAALEPVMFGDALKGGHNFGFDLQSVAKYYQGRLPTGPYFCTLWAAHVLDSRYANWLGLDDCLKREFGHTMVKGVGKDVSLHSFADVAEYGAQDGEWTWRLLKRYHQRLRDEQGRKPFRLDMDVLAVTCRMELTGARIDVAALKALKAKLEDDVEEAKGRVYAAAGKAFPINSNPTKQQLLYGSKADGGRALRPKKLTPAGKTLFMSGAKTALELKHYSVDAEALEHYRDVDELATALLDYADLNKLMTTYVIPYLGGDIQRTTAGKTKTVTKASLMHEGRIHTRFAPITETGRFSSRNPNLQNVPNASTERGKAIRNLFTCAPDEALVVADYSQIEPRVTASFTGEKRLINAYLNGEDVYVAIADPFGLPRKAGKVLFLALSYGVGPDKIAASIGIPLQKSKQLLKDFEEEFADIYKYKAQLCREARARKPVPYVTTLVGRRRYLPDLKSDNYGFKSRAERQAFNTRIQGSAADIMKIAMVRAHGLIPPQARMVLTVHDELVTVTPRSLADDTAEAIREAMEGVHALDVPLLADVKIVDKWGEAK